METIYYVLGAPPAVESIWSRFGPVIVGFVLTTILGGLFTWRLGVLSGARQARLELFRKRYDEGTALLSDVSCLLDTRCFTLQRLLWAVSAGAEAKVLIREEEYFEVVIKWNNALHSNRNKIRLLIGEPEADGFLDYGDDARRDDPRSIHYQFVNAHEAVMAARNSSERQTRAAQETVTRLDHSISIFLERLTTGFSQQANSLAILELPSKGGEEGRIELKRHHK
jgi:hypothetical protein